QRLSELRKPSAVDVAGLLRNNIDNVLRPVARGAVDVAGLLRNNIDNVLRPVARGGGQQQVVRIAPGATPVLLQLIIDPEKAKDSRYQVMLQDVNGIALWNSKDDPSAVHVKVGNTLIIAIPADKFQNGRTQIIMLWGATTGEAGSYQFRVEARAKQ